MRLFRTAALCTSILAGACSDSPGTPTDVAHDGSASSGDGNGAGGAAGAGDASMQTAGGNAGSAGTDSATGSTGEAGSVGDAALDIPSNPTDVMSEAGTDAGSADGSTVDDAEAAPVPGPVHVTVARNSGGTAVPVADRTVVFINPNGTVVAKPATDALGKASADVLPGASVTVIGYDLPGDLVTTLAVTPGDDLVYDFGSSCADSPGSMTIDWIGLIDATSYVAYAPGLTGATTNLNATIDGSCLSPNFDVVVLAKSASGSTLGFTGATNRTFVSGGEITLGPWSSIGSYGVSYSSIPNNAALSVDASLFDNGTAYLSGFGTVPYTGSTGQLYFALPGLGDQISVNTIVASASTARQQIHDVFGRTAVSIVDIGASLLPWITVPTIDFSTLTANWTSQGAGTADGLVMRLIYASDAGQRSWNIISPAVTSLKLPALPAELASLAPHQGDTVAAYPRLVESSDWSDYTAMRRAKLSTVLEELVGGGSAAHTRVSLALDLP